MASIGDYIFLIIVLGIIGGIVYAVKGSQVDGAVQKQKDAMKAKGIHLSRDGISVKTNKVKTRTQASWAKSGEVMSKHKKAFSYGPGSGETNGAKAETNTKKK